MEMMKGGRHPIRLISQPGWQATKSTVKGSTANQQQKQPPPPKPKTTTTTAATARTISMDGDSGLGSDSDSYHYAEPISVRAQLGTGRPTPDHPAHPPLPAVPTAGYDYDRSPVSTFVRERRLSKQRGASKLLSRSFEAVELTPLAGRGRQAVKIQPSFSGSEDESIARFATFSIATGVGKSSRTHASPDGDNNNSNNHCAKDKNNNRNNSNNGDVSHGMANWREEIPNSRAKAKLHSSQASLPPPTPSKSPADRGVCASSGVARQPKVSGSLGSRQSKVSSNYNLSAHRSVEDLILSRQGNEAHCELSDQSKKRMKKTRKPPQLEASEKPPVPAKVKNKNNLRLIMPAAERLRQTNPPKSAAPAGPQTPPRPAQSASKYQRVRSLDSTPQSSLGFNLSSLPTPEKSKSSTSTFSPALSVFKKFFSLNFRSKSSSTAPELPVSCRRRLFSEEQAIREGEVKTCDGKSTVRFTKNDKSGQAWLGGGRRQISTEPRSARSQPTTPAGSDCQIASDANADGDRSAAESMRTVLSIFVASSKNRIIKQLLKLESLEVNGNSASLVLEEAFREKRRDLLAACQSMLTSFGELSLCLFDPNSGRFRLQADYCKNSEPFVERLVEFLESSVEFVGFLFASWAKYQFRSMAKDVAKDACHFLETSHAYVDGGGSSGGSSGGGGSSGAFKELDDRFNGFSERFEKLIRWTKELQFADTISVLW